jgi:hypothetical protein
MTMAIPVKFFPGFFSCEKFILLSPIPTFFVATKPTKHDKKLRAASGTSANYTYEFFFAHTFLYLQRGAICL